MSSVLACPECFVRRHLASPDCFLQSHGASGDRPAFKDSNRPSGCLSPRPSPVKNGERERSSAGGGSSDDHAIERSNYLDRYAVPAGPFDTDIDSAPGAMLQLVWLRISVLNTMVTLLLLMVETELMVTLRLGRYIRPV